MNFNFLGFGLEGRVSEKFETAEDFDVLDWSEVIECCKSGNAEVKNRN